MIPLRPRAGQLMSFQQLIADLSEPGAYPFAVDRVDVRHTHISVLFFAAERVYKVKKPLRLPFLDATGLARRLELCREEVRLNRRLAPDVYQGVAEIVLGPDGRHRVLDPEATSGGGAAAVVEHAVAMRRLPADGMLDAILDRGAIDDTMLDQIADVLVRFHAAAATGPGVDEHGAPAAVRRMVLDNLAQLAPRSANDGFPLSPLLHSRLLAAARAFLDRHRALMEARVRRGRIRDGHGDLHAGNVCFTPGGVVAYDCLEFAAHLRCGDVAKDLAFLVMDLDAHGVRDSGRRLARRYAGAAADEDLHALLPFYSMHLAAVRVNVQALVAAADEVPAAERAAARAAARHYGHVAASYTLPPALLLMCGVPGSGKSWLARHLARPLGAVVLRSDEIRKSLAGLAPAQRARGEDASRLYSREFGERTYRAMLEQASTRLSEGRSVIVDATMPAAAMRAPFLELARGRGAPLVVIHVDPPEALISERLRHRALDPGEVSDADAEVSRRARSSFEPPREIPAGRLVTTDGTAEPERDAGEVIDRLLGQAPLDW